jgi:aspartate racemase
MPFARGYSLGCGPVEQLQHNDKWAELTGVMVKAARAVEAGGAQFLVICSNTMHKVADEVEASVSIPLLHIADTTASAILSAGAYGSQAGASAAHAPDPRPVHIKTVGLLGTRFTMEEDFYKERLARRGLKVVVPGAKDRQLVHDVIYRELCLGTVREESKQLVLQLIGRLIERGAQGVILGCTELPLLVRQGDVPLQVFDTTRIHAEKAVDVACSV